MVLAWVSVTVSYRRVFAGFCEITYTIRQVLGDRGEVELVAGTGEASQPQAIEAVMGFQMRKAHFDLSPLVA